MPFSDFRFEMMDNVDSAQIAAAWAPFVETTIEAFGSDRCMMESNYPPDGYSVGYIPSWNALKTIVKDYSPDERASLFYRTAAAVYKIDM